MLELSSTDLSELIREVVDRHRDTALRSGSEIRVEAPEAAAGVWDRSRLDQVATNLVSNAIKFGAGKPIDVRVWREGDRVRFSVQDGGIGIAPEDQVKIFERFERAVSRRSYGGLGLGLWISRQIVDAPGGRIDVESELGRGSRFIVDVPREAVVQPEADPDSEATMEFPVPR